MQQMFFGILAIAILSLLMLTVNRSIYANETRMMLNEISLGVTSVGSELLNEIGSYPYDPVALNTTTATVMGDRSMLRPSGTFGLQPDGSPVSCDPDNNFSGCLFIIDFHGKSATRTLTRTYGGVNHTITYEVDIKVRYVEEEPPHAPCTENGSTCPVDDKTFAKEAVLTITAPELYLGSQDNPLEITMARVYTYPNL